MMNNEDQALFRRDEWAMAWWFDSPNSNLDGRLLTFTENCPTYGPDAQRKLTHPGLFRCSVIERIEWRDQRDHASQNPAATLPGGLFSASTAWITFGGSRRVGFRERQNPWNKVGRELRQGPESRGSRQKGV